MTAIYLSENEYNDLYDINGRAPTKREKSEYIKEKHGAVGKPDKERYYHEGEEVSKYHAWSLSLYDPDRKIGKRPEHLTKARKPDYTQASNKP